MCNPNKGIHHFFRFFSTFHSHFFHSFNRPKISHIPPSSFNTPLWNPNPAHLRRFIPLLTLLTPPTAITVK